MKPKKTNMRVAGGSVASWRLRRRVIFGTLIFCAIEVAYLTVFGKDSGLHQSITGSLILLAGSTVGSYVFGAAWDDANARKASVQAGGTETEADPEPPEGEE